MPPYVSFLSPSSLPLPLLPLIPPSPPPSRPSFLPPSLTELLGKREHVVEKLQEFEETIDPIVQLFEDPEVQEYLEQKKYTYIHVYTVQCTCTLSVYYTVYTISIICVANKWF